MCPRKGLYSEPTVRQPCRVVRTGSATSTMRRRYSRLGHQTHPLGSSLGDSDSHYDPRHEVRELPSLVRRARRDRRHHHRSPVSMGSPQAARRGHHHRRRGMPMTNRSPSAKHLLVERIAARLAAQLSAAPDQNVSAPRPPAKESNVKSVPDAHRPVRMGAAEETLQHHRTQQ